MYMRFFIVQANDFISYTILYHNDRSRSLWLRYVIRHIVHYKLAVIYNKQLITLIIEKILSGNMSR